MTIPDHVRSKPLADQIAQAIGDPGSIVGRKLGPSWEPGEDGYAEVEETVVRWGVRAVRATLAAEFAAPASHENPAAIAGPWRAVLADIDDRTVYDSVEAARAELGYDGEVMVAVVRGTAMPQEIAGRLYRPGVYDAGDLAYEVDGYVVDADASLGAAARYAQARAMAAGLNLAADILATATSSVPDGKETP